MNSAENVRMNSQEIYNLLMMRYTPTPVILVEGPEDVHLLEQVFDDNQCVILSADGSKNVKFVRQEIGIEDHLRNHRLVFPIVFLLDADFSDLSTISEKYLPGSGTVVTKYNDLDAELFFEMSAADVFISRRIARNVRREAEFRHGIKSFSESVVGLYESLIRILENQREGEYIPFGGKSSVRRFTSERSFELKSSQVAGLKESNTLEIVDHESFELAPCMRMNGHLLMDLSLWALGVVYDFKPGKDFSKQVRSLFGPRDYLNLPSVQRVVNEIKSQGGDLQLTCPVAA